jgi:hypothetical protein
MRRPVYATSNAAPAIIDRDAITVGSASGSDGLTFIVGQTTAASCGAGGSEPSLVAPRSLLFTVP